MPLFPNSQLFESSQKAGFFKRSWRLLKFFFCLVGLLTVSTFAALVFFIVRADFSNEIKEGTILRLNLDDGLYESRPTDLFSSVAFGESPTVFDIVTGIRRAAKDPKITLLVAYTTNTDLEIGRAHV